MADVLKKVPVREQEPKVRATNFEEVCYGYNKEEAMEEASSLLYPRQTSLKLVARSFASCSLTGILFNTSILF